MNKRQQTLHRKRLAYLRTFCNAEGIPHEEGRRVLADLKRFCGINRGGLVISPVSRVVDSHATVYRAALRDAYLRIVGFINLDEDEILEESSDAEISDPASKPE
jgi:hypothetical protein